MPLCFADAFNRIQQAQRELFHVSPLRSLRWYRRYDSAVSASLFAFWYSRLSATVLKADLLGVLLMNVPQFCMANYYINHDAGNILLVLG